MHTRPELHAALQKALGSNQVYFQPPANVRMKYPAIVYNQVRDRAFHANGNPYIHRTFYRVIVISPDPDNTITGKVAALPTANAGRRYIADNLYHDPFDIYI